MRINRLATSMKISRGMRVTVIGLALSTLAAARGHALMGFIEVSPRLPTSQDVVAVRVNAGHGVNFEAPSVAGNQIVLRGVTSASGTVSTLFSLAPLAPGDWVIEVQLDGMAAGSQALTVAAPSGDLELIDHRFVATTGWYDAHGIVHLANAVQLSDNFGFFSFFDSSNGEVTIKILDGRAVNGHFWVFIASMTDVQFFVRIDSACVLLPNPSFCGPPLATYKSPAGKNVNFIDLGTL
jgi:hypothetical protein